MSRTDWVLVACTFILHCAKCFASIFRVNPVRGCLLLASRRIGESSTQVHTASERPPEPPMAPGSLLASQFHILNRSAVSDHSL